VLGNDYYSGRPTGYLGLPEGTLPELEADDDLALQPDRSQDTGLDAPLVGDLR
jgi:hypothetical protein